MVVLTETKSDLSTEFTWTTGSGFSVTVISFGAIIKNIRVPDKHGVVKDVVLGFDTAKDYETKENPYFGALVGRCANRIAGGKFSLDGVDYQLAKNDGNNTIHGGIVGFNKKNWTATVDGTKVVYTYLSRDGEEGFPGDLVTNVVYQVTEDNELHVEYIATTTKKTVVNLTNHSYFNLAGHDAGAREIYNHVITVNADRITETNSESIPTGRFLDVGGTNYDLRTPKRLGDLIDKDDELYDDNFCVNTYGNKDLNFVSRVVHPSSGRFLEVFSDRPGVQVYTAKNMPKPSEKAIEGKGGVGYRRHGAVCFETQAYPDAVNHPNFPSAVLTPGYVYSHKVIYKFGAVADRDSYAFNNGPLVSKM